MYTLFETNDHLKIVSLNHELNLSLACKERIDEIWEQDSKYKRLHNSLISNVLYLKNNEIYISKVPYKNFYAKYNSPAYFNDMKIQPLAVSGILLCNEGIVFGKRSTNVLQEKGKWEFMPSGSIEWNDGEINLQNQLIRELEEEIGIIDKQLEYTHPFLIVKDELVGVYDVFFLISADVAWNELKNKFKAQKKEEHTEISLIHKTKIKKYSPNSDASELMNVVFKYFKNNFEKFKVF